MSQIDLRWIGSAVYPPGATYGPYTPRNHELVWIAEGDAALEADGTTYPAPANTVLLTSPGGHHVYRWDPGHTTRHAYVHFSYVGRERDWPVARHLADDDIIVSLVRHMLWLEAERPDDWRALVVGALEHAVRAYIAGASRTAADPRPELPAVIQRSAIYVRDRWNRGPARSPSLDELAAAASVTPEHLCRVYKRTIGCGPIEALRSIRLRRGANMLARSNTSVAAVADQCGFVNQFHFSKAFKNAFGVAPRDFRAGQRADVDTEWFEPARRLAAFLP